MRNRKHRICSITKYMLAFFKTGWTTAYFELKRKMPIPFGKRTVYEHNIDDQL